MLILINDSFPAERMMQVGRYWRNNNTKARRLWVRGGWWVILGTICPPLPPHGGWTPGTSSGHRLPIWPRQLTCTILPSPPLNCKIHLCHKKSTFVTKNPPLSQKSHFKSKITILTTPTEPPLLHNFESSSQSSQRVHHQASQSSQETKKRSDTRANHNHLEHHHLTGMNPISG